MIAHVSFIEWRCALSVPHRIPGGTAIYRYILSIPLFWTLLISDRYCMTPDRYSEQRAEKSTGMPSAGARARGCRSVLWPWQPGALGHCLPARARVKVGRSAHFSRQAGRQQACMHCLRKNRLNFSDLSSDHACRILAGWLAGWRAAANPAQMGWKWSAGGKCMTPRARCEKKLNVVVSEKPF